MRKTIRRPDYSGSMVRGEATALISETGDEEE